MSDFFIYTLFAIALFIAELIYFIIAKRYKIIDHPNERSSHETVTIRGGGIIIPFSIFASAFVFKDVWFFLIGALFIIAIISFLDDIKDVPNYIRFLIHIAAVSMILTSIHAFKTWPIWIIIIAFVLIIGVINAFNFMDGINGITGVYSLVLLTSLLFVNQKFNFIHKSFIIIPIIANMVFLYFNFRKKAKCFAGDVGSVSIGFWIAILLLMVITKTGDLKYIFFLSIYGVDTVLTILHRLVLKQNIFRAHRMHFFQYLVNERKIPHLAVALLYGSVQMLINIFILVTNYNFIITLLVVTVPAALAYWFFKFLVKPTNPASILTSVNQT